MLKHLGPQAKKKLLKLFNASWKTSNTPKTWEKAITIPILKYGKCRTKAESYRPISLTSSVCIANGKDRQRTTQCGCSNKTNSLNALTSGLQAIEITAADQLAYISQMIEDGFQEKKHTVAVWIDMEKTFDKVWTEGLVNNLNNINISHEMLHWIKNYLKNRQALVKTNRIRSKTENLQNGVFQGGVLSPTLFLIFINDIQKQISRKVYPSLYMQTI